ncbi:hypothetical protein [Flavobacterium rhizosphaerae]|uniref:Stage 0 sporulation protein A homolog n=1 Tax=Flavobacterium rhizosphaerae TaxID=3163298 RepID=A0ABW8Z1F6_9FLAO
MKKKILVYDRQFGYYKLIKELKKEYDFSLSGTDIAHNGYEGMVFIMSDALEMPAFVQLFREDIPILLGIRGRGNNNGMLQNDNVVYLDLEDTKYGMVKKLDAFLDRIKTKKLL